MSSKVKVKQSLGPFAITENHSSDVPLLIDADAREASLESLRNMIGALTFLHEMISKGTATISTRHNTLGISRGELKQLDKFLGASDDLKQEAELRKNLLLEANTEVHRLREEMAKGVTIEAIGNKLYQLDRSIYNWWQNLGFSYSKSILQPNFKGASFVVEFSVGIDRHVSINNPKPVTARLRKNAKHAVLGKELEIAQSDNDSYVIDSPNNRIWFTNKFKERFPTCRITKWESISVFRQEGQFQIRHVEVYIDITDIGDIFEKNENFDNV